MKKLLSIVLALTMLLSASTLVSAEVGNPFVDVAADAWYHDEVVEAVYTGIINGKSATEFKPDDLLTYAEAIKLAACMYQLYKDYEWAEGETTDILTVLVDGTKMDSDCKFRCTVTDTTGRKLTSKEAYIIITADATVDFKQGGSSKDQMIVIMP